MKPITTGGRLALTAAIILCALQAGQVSARAGVSFVIDRDTLGELLAALVADRVEVPLGPENTITVYLEDLKITGLDPSAGGERQGYVHTSLKVRVPEIGVELAVRPRISLNVAEKEGSSMLEVRFEELVLPLPLVNSINVAALIRPIRYDTDAVWLLDGARGDVPVSSSLKEIVMGREAIRFLFDVEVLPAVGGGS
jgi:hypothetical protein